MTLDPITSAHVAIRDATPADSDFICQKLAETFTTATAEQRKVHFDVPWPTPAGGRDYGVVAHVGDRIVGFGGLFASERRIAGRLVRVLNYSSWWIDPELRGAGIGRKLIEGIFAPRTSSVITLLTLPASMLDFWLRQGVQRFEHERRAYPFPMLRPAAWRGGVTVLPRGTYPDALGHETIRILKDHEPLRCQALVLERRGQFCGVITRRRSIRVPAVHWPGPARWLGERLAVADTASAIRLFRARVSDLLLGQLQCAEVFFVSNPTFFRDHFWNVGSLLARRQRAVALLGDATRLGVPAAWGLPADADYWTWRPSPVPDDQIDALYSEFFVLPIGQESR